MRFVQGKGERRLAVRRGRGVDITVRTAIVILIGLAALAVFVGAAPLIATSTSRVGAAYLFLAVWFVFCVVDWYVGVFRAGYPAMEELGIHALIFAVPAAATLLLIWKLRA